MSEFYDDPTFQTEQPAPPPDASFANVPPPPFEDASGLEYAPLQGHGRRRGSHRVRRSLVAGGIVAALGVGAIGGGALALAHANTPRASGLVGATTLAQGKGHPRHGRFGPPAPLTITAVSGGTITATRPNGTKVTIHTTSSTTYARAGKSVNASALAPNEHIRVRGSRASDGSITATHIDIALPSYAGVVTAVTSSAITVKDPSGATHIIDVSASTAYFTGRGPQAQSSRLSAVAVGDRVAAEGTLNGDGSLNAQRVEIALPGYAGTVTAVKGTTITLKDRAGATHTIDVSASTKYDQGRGPNAPSASLSAIKVGEMIAAEGTLNGDGSLNAQVIHIGPMRPAGPPQGKGAPPAPGTSPANMPQGAPGFPGAAPAGL